MAAIRPEDVEHIAQLARLTLTSEEREKFSVQLSSILDYVEKLNELETTNIIPTSQVTDLLDQTRQDMVTRQPEDVVSDILREVPESEAGGMKVPTVLQE